MSLPSKAQIDLLHKVESPHRIMLFCVPTKCIRLVTIDETFRTFRVEQLVITNNSMHNPRGTWTTLSTHGSETPGASYMDAFKAAEKAQQDLIRKVQRQQQKKRLVMP